MPSVPMFSHAFPASPTELAGLREELRGWLEDNDVSEDVERGVVLAVSEAAANAVEHGYGCNGTGLVTVVAHRLDGRLEISVRDEGVWQEASSDTDRGRGLDIIRAIVEELSIRHEHGATVLRMRTAANGSAPQ